MLTNFVSFMWWNDFHHRSIHKYTIHFPLSEVFAVRTVGTLFGAIGLNSSSDMSKKRLLMKGTAEYESLLFLQLQKSSLFSHLISNKHRNYKNNKLSFLLTFFS